MALQTFSSSRITHYLLFLLPVPLFLQICSLEKNTRCYYSQLKKKKSLNLKSQHSDSGCNRKHQNQLFNTIKNIHSFGRNSFYTQLQISSLHSTMTKILKIVFPSSDLVDGIITIITSRFTLYKNKNVECWERDAPQWGSGSKLTLLLCNLWQIGGGALWSFFIEKFYPNAVNTHLVMRKERKEGKKGSIELKPLSSHHCSQTNSMF